jgi:TetR/AcrR family transcriptional repressor of lmrAB and yxaGH operons
MRTQKVDPDDVDLKLFETFSELGYDGASMELLAQATGLKKASLYHRFPNGKKEMAKHVLSIVEEWIKQNIVSVAANKKLKPEARLKKVIASIDELYNGGANNCLLRTLTVGSDSEEFKENVRSCFDLLADGFTDIAIDFGLSPKEAKQRVRFVNLIIQGSLVLAGATGDKGYFRNGLAKISALLTT